MCVTTAQIPYCLLKLSLNDLRNFAFSHIHNGTGYFLFLVLRDVVLATWLSQVELMLLLGRRDSWYPFWLLSLLEQMSVG